MGRFECYLINRVGLSPNRRYTFLFEDGTGFHGYPVEFNQYAERRFQVFSDDSYEIDKEDDGGDVSYEIPPPQHEGQELQDTPLDQLKDPRF